MNEQYTAFDIENLTATLDVTGGNSNEVSETVEEATTTESVGFEPSNFIDNLGHMGNGMLGIFVVIGIIILITYALNKISKKK